MKQEVIQKAGEQPKQQGPNLTGIPTQMKLDFERRSGLSFDDVRVHYHSDKPAKFDAGAYTYGTDVFIGPGDTGLLRHELNHVVQQMRGQVRPTGMEHGLAVNRSPALEYSADTGAVAQTVGMAVGPVVQCAPSFSLRKDRNKQVKLKYNIDNKYNNRDMICHSFTASVLKSFAHDDQSLRNMNKDAQKLCQKVQIRVPFHGPDTPEQMITPQGDFAQRVYQQHYDSLQRKGNLLQYELTPQNYLQQNANRFPGLLLFVNHQNIVVHSMIAKDATTWMGTNNGTTFGAVNASSPIRHPGQYAPPLGVSVYSNIQNIYRNQNAQNGPTGGWDVPSNQFISSTGAPLSVYLIPFP